jgi:hypothetical protein
MWLAVGLAGCANPLVGEWSNANESLQVTDDQYKLTDARYPQASLATIDPANPEGYLFTGGWKTADDILTVEGHDGLYPRSVVGWFRETVGFAVEGDQLGLDALRGPRSGLLGDWSGASTKNGWSTQDETGMPLVDETTTVMLSLASDHGARKVTTTSGPGQASDDVVTLTGTWQLLGINDVSISWTSSEPPASAEIPGDDWYLMGDALVYGVLKRQ